MVKLIKTDDQHRAALARIDHLMAADPAPGTRAGDELELLAHLVEVYEKNRFPIAAPDPVDAILFRMEQLGLSRRDLVPHVGSPSKVSEILNRRRPLTLKMVRALSQSLGIPADILVGRPGNGLPQGAEDLQWERFPLGEMVRRGWIGRPGLLPSQARGRAEELMRQFFGQLDLAVLAPACRRQHVRSGSTMDDYALMAWTARVMNLASADPPRGAYRKGGPGRRFIRELLDLSPLADGPRRVRDALSGVGISLVIERHLPRTHLDGAALLASSGHPIVALTLRYDRVDHFWYTLFHELAHVSHHLHVSNGPGFLDDLMAAGDDRETEADTLAADWLIPREEWLSASARETRAASDVLSLARRLRIHPAIVAGRVRREAGNYRLLSRMVGCGEVRQLFA